MRPRFRAALPGAALGIGLACLSLSTYASADAEAVCVAASDRGQALLHAKHLMLARASLLTCAEPACPGSVQSDCRARLAQVNASMPTVVVSVRDRRGAEVTGARVVVDGAPFLDTVDGIAREVDPGVHRFHVELASGETFDEEVAVHEGQKNRLVVFSLAPPAAPDQEAPPREHTVYPWIVVAAGGAAVITGAALFGVEQGSSGSHWKPAGEVTLGIGAALVVGGLIWHFLEPHGSAATALHPTPESADLGAGLRF